LLGVHYPILFALPLYRVYRPGGERASLIYRIFLSDRQSG